MERHRLLTQSRLAVALLCLTLLAGPGEAAATCLVGKPPPLQCAGQVAAHECPVPFKAHLRECPEPLRAIKGVCALAVGLCNHHRGYDRLPASAPAAAAAAPAPCVQAQRLGSAWLAVHTFGWLGAVHAGSGVRGGQDWQSSSAATTRLALNASGTAG